MNETKILNFSLGPVQNFIAQARKTRDFWTGSFLLSYLAGQAMAVILEKGGRLILPAITENKKELADPLLQAIVERRNGREITRADRNKAIVATLPNRFRAKVPVGFVPAWCEKAIIEKWNEIATLIWERYLDEPARLGKGTKEIWTRQVKHFWEMNWVISADPAALDLRKNWRTHLPATEPGDKCTLFGELQELSGYLRMHEREQQDHFWGTLGQQREAGIFYDLDENERLCSIAFIKRFFPYIAREVIFDVPVRYPSTPNLAAINWIAAMVESKPEAARSFAQKATSLLPGARGRENPDLFSKSRVKLHPFPQAREFASLDGNCFYKAALENPNLWDRPSSPVPGTEKAREELANLLKDLGKPPSPFYALLLLDGDRLGALLQEHPGETESISKSMSRFSLGVPSLVEKGNGITVFAGGDDVLALLPLEDALPTAKKLYQSFLESFRGCKFPPPSISGSIVYAHFNTPLTEVYHEAQHLLADVAKEKTGRDSLAVTIWKSAGRVLTWSAPWEIVNGKLTDFLRGLKRDLTSEKELKEFSSSFFYNIQRRIAFFTGKGMDLSSVSTPDLLDLLTAEYIKSRGLETERTQAKAIMEKLLKLCRPYWKDLKGKTCKDETRLQLDSLFLTKFLVEKGVEP